VIVPGRVAIDPRGARRATGIVSGFQPLGLAGPPPWPAAKAAMSRAFGPSVDLVFRLAGNSWCFGPPETGGLSRSAVYGLEA
jgi:hypothetical protein